MEKKPIIRIKNLSKTFKISEGPILDDISLDIYAGEFLTLLGPSGCGKTTLLRLLGGFETPTGGHIFIHGKDMQHISPRHRPIHTVFQTLAIFPHMSVAQNIAYGLEVEGQSNAYIEARVKEMLALVKLEKYAQAMPDKLSGGQKQRVALARALAKKPDVLLLDEPLSALDAKLRETMQIELVRLQKLLGITFIMVTHDQEEALAMSTRIAVMFDGKIVQVSDPSHLYEFPTTLQVAQFIGRINCLSGTVKKDKNDTFFSCPIFEKIPLPSHHLKMGKATLAIRPEKIFTEEQEPQITHSLVIKGKVDTVIYCGKFSLIYFDIGLKTPLLVDVANVLRDIDYYTFRPGEIQWCHWRIKDCLIF